MMSLGLDVRIERDDFDDDRTTEAGDATPRSVSEPCEILDTIKRTCWADMEDSDSDGNRGNIEEIATKERICWADSHSDDEQEAESQESSEKWQSESQAL